MSKSKNEKSASSKKTSVGSTPLLTKSKPKGGKLISSKKTLVANLDSSKIIKTIEVYKDQKDFFKMDLKYNSKGFATRAIHAGNTPDPIHGGVCPAIDLSSTYAQPAPGVLASAFDYTRAGNPTVMALQRNLAALEQGKFAFALNSGMSATVSVLSLLKQGDHIICIDDVYGGTQRYLRMVYGPQSGNTFDFVDLTNLENLKKAIKPNTRMCWIETPTNPTLKCTDIQAVSKICKAHGILLCIDNTFMSPVLQQPLQLGADIVMHSLTKYIGGHSDVVAGALVFNDQELYDKLYFNIKSLGTMIAPFDAWIVLRGSKTLQVRVERACENAIQIAKWLEKHPKVEKVLYPGLASHPHHKIALKNRSKPKYSGGSGMISFYLKGDLQKTNKFLSSVEIFTLAESLGGVESLIESPALMTHGSVPPATRKMLGIDDNFVRISVGIEELDDLINDLNCAFDKI